MDCQADSLLVEKAASDTLHRAVVWSLRRSQAGRSDRVGKRTKLVACLLLQLAGSTVAMGFVGQHLRSGRSGSLGTEFAEETLAQWWSSPSMEGEMATATANPDFSAAFQAFKCLADYNMFQWLLAENAKGTPVLTNELVAVYVLQWKPFMRGSRATAFLESFGDYQHRHRWSSRFRKGWGILYKKLRARSGLADGLAQERVDLFLQWSLWCHQVVADLSSLVVVNMDETSLGLHTLGESKTGMYSYSAWLWRVPIVVTIDMSATWGPLEPWIAANSVDAFLHGPSYIMHI